MDKKIRRLRRARKTRAKIAELGAIRLCVHRSNTHIYAQLIDASGGVVLTSASTIEKELRDQIKNGGNVAAAKLIGQRIAEKAKALGVEKVSFDRAGFAFHGRVKALADAAREHGLQF
ncbi:MAG: 50S ribosomal protein L18 [Betaproteobacteria bacterium]|jgi:large subunit ribosomal protein L18|nr:MAG: rplR [bacterium]KAF0147732.1 MAG: rplR [bacterium]KAF0166818.1 MAG: rplR [bacterium]MBM4181823.1 50S ribosomal protein L18 [Betaproteobacteria bacterium]TXT22874.1 MAG: rplR [bacterium]